MTVRTRRWFEPSTITAVSDRGEVTHDGWTFLWPEAAGPVPEVGQTLHMETVQFSRFTSLVVDGVLRWTQTDEDLDEADRKFREDAERRDRERLDRMRSEWIGHEEHLPPWGKRRLARFRAAGGEKFELEGWGYELCICRLAALYVEEGLPETNSPDTDPPKVQAFASAEGTTGNQHDCARALARLVLAGREDDAAGGVPAGLAPLTGSADYS